MCFSLLLLIHAPVGTIAFWSFLRDKKMNVGTELRSNSSKTLGYVNDLIPVGGTFATPYIISIPPGKENLSPENGKNARKFFSPSRAGK